MAAKTTGAPPDRARPGPRKVDEDDTCRGPGCTRARHRDYDGHAQNYCSSGCEARDEEGRRAADTQCGADGCTNARHTDYDGEQKEYCSASCELQAADIGGESLVQLREQIRAMRQQLRQQQQKRRETSWRRSWRHCV
jgi:hypothetical protein